VSGTSAPPSLPLRSLGFASVRLTLPRVRAEAMRVVEAARVRAILTRPRQRAPSTNNHE
jgi:hypothetical protein